MKKMLTIIAVALAAMLTAAPVQAVTYSQNVQTSPIKNATYRATFLGLVPAASATDFLTITGSATKTVKVTRAECAGTTTAAATAVIVALKRSAADTGGTSTTATNVPLDSISAAATAVVKGYTVNPTTGTLVGNVAAGLLTTNTVASSAFSSMPLSFLFGGGATPQSIALRGVAQQFALNGNAASLSAGASLACDVEWTEE